MYQKPKQNNKRLKPNQIKLHSVRQLNFNEEWSRQYQNPQPQHTQHTLEKINEPITVSKHPSNKGHNPFVQKPHFNDKKKRMINFEHVADTSQVYDAPQVYPKKKAFSQLQSYRKLGLSQLQNRASRPQQHLQQSHSNIQQNLSLVVNPIKPNLKLPIINPSQGKVAVRLQQSQKSHLKTMKFTLQKQQDNDFSSQVTTQALKNKAKDIARLNRRFFQDRVNTEVCKYEGKGMLGENQSGEIGRFGKVKKFIKIKGNKNQKIATERQTSELHSQIIESQQKQLAKLSMNQKIQQHNNDSQKHEQPSKPIIYDKKMKIGRKKRSEQDRIRAMLLKTLQKTSGGKDYIAQQGTSQKHNSPRVSQPKTKRSLSKQPSEQSRVILVQQEQKTVRKTNSLSRAELERIRKGLAAKERASEPRQPKSYVNNKKFVSMVREGEEKRRKCVELEEIRQEKTLSREQNQEDKTEKDSEKNTAEQKPSIKPLDKAIFNSKCQASPQNSQNQFLAYSPRIS